MDPRTPPTDTHAPPAIRLRDPAGAVAAVPYLLGFTPQRSLVVVGIDDDRSVGASLRCDYEPGCPPGTTAALWEHLQRVLLRNGCHTSLLLVYTSQDPEDLPSGWVDGLLRAARPDREDDPVGGDVEDRTAQVGGPRAQDPAERLAVLDVLVVGPSRFRSVLCGDPSCCPPEGTPVSEAGHHPVAAGFVLAGRNPAADRASVAPEGTATPDERARALAATRAADDVLLPPAIGSQAGVGSQAAVGSRAAAHLIGRWAASLPGGPDPELAGTLAAAWRASTGLRDACLALLLPGAPPRPGARPLRLDEVLADPACARATGVGSPVLRRMAALTTGPQRATVLAAHAWLCWVAGEGTAAGVLAERAQRSGHDQPLATLVLQCLDHGVGPPWTSSRPGAAPRPPCGRS